MPEQKLSTYRNVDWERQAKEEAAQAAKDACRVLNNMTYEDVVIESFIDQLSREHRTLQQAFGRMLVAAIEHFAIMHNRGTYDLRNEATCQMCAALHKKLEEGTLKHLPFV